MQGFEEFSRAVMSATIRETEAIVPDYEEAIILDAQADAASDVPVAHKALKAAADKAREKADKLTDAQRRDLLRELYAECHATLIRCGLPTRKTKGSEPVTVPAADEIASAS